MRIHSWVKILGAGSIVYVVVAACGGAGGGGGGLLADGGTWFDAVSDPVPEAWAAPIVVESPCTTMGPTGSGSTNYFAVAAFPGKSVDDLASIQVWGVMTAEFAANKPPGYTHAGPLSMFIQPGSAAAACGTEVNGQLTVHYSSVRFYLPQ